jgi:catechol 2,3-dioxygenase-like lactoylglutathione lyase family enzyme
MTLLDHLTLNVSDYARSKAFYTAALAPLGVKPIMEFGEACGFGRAQKPDFWIGKGPTSFQTPEQIAILSPMHVAFSARSRAEVSAFHAAALAAGGKDFGCGRCTTPTISARSCSTPTDTTSRPCFMARD